MSQEIDQDAAFEPGPVFLYGVKGNGIGEGDLHATPDGLEIAEIVVVIRAVKGFMSDGLIVGEDIGLYQ